MTFDALAALRQSGNSVKERLDAVSDTEVEGQSSIIKIA